MGNSVRRTIFKLSATAVAKKKKPGHYGDGGGLWLQVSTVGTKSWVFRFTLNGKAREMGLGALHTVTLADARDKAADCRKQVLDGTDPIEARGAQRLTSQAAAARALTFDQCAGQYIETHRSGWRNEKHAEQWTNTLATYASPVFGKLPVAAVDTALVLKVLTPIWAVKTETAKRVRGRVESVLSWAAAQKLRTGENPARWKGHLDNLLAPPEKVTRVEHHAALPYVEMGEFMQALRAEQGTSARAVELIILTAARTSEVFNATRDEFDLDAGIWTVPGERMKAGKPHRVPLSDAALALIKSSISDTGSSYIFPGAREGRPLSNMAGLMLLKRMGRADLTVHGFRSSFRDWAAEQTNFPREIAEAALAHTVESKVEAAYQRGDLLLKRSKLMQAWADYCARPVAAANVVNLSNRSAA
ncbi:MAG: integrase arm-type DNA-binding domain-containing protein [Rubrivivax sp.]|nr:integrase arm-type DNA-binding domain-containing protein [Rubrivivax sp.]